MFTLESTLKTPRAKGIAYHHGTSTLAVCLYNGSLYLSNPTVSKFVQVSPLTLRSVCFHRELIVAACDDGYLYVYDFDIFVRKIRAHSDFIRRVASNDDILVSVGDDMAVKAFRNFEEIGSQKCHEHFVMDISFKKSDSDLLEVIQESSIYDGIDEEINSMHGSETGRNSAKSNEFSVNDFDNFNSTDTKPENEHERKKLSQSHSEKDNTNNNNTNRSVDTKNNDNTNSNNTKTGMKSHINNNSNSNNNINNINNLGAKISSLDLFAGYVKFLTCSMDCTIKEHTFPFTSPITLSAHSEGVNSCCYLNNYILSCSDDLTTKIYDNYKNIFTIKGHSKNINIVRAFKGFFVTGSEDGLVKIYCAKSWKCLENIDLKCRIWDVLFYNNNLIVASDDGIHKFKSAYTSIIEIFNSKIYYTIQDKLNMIKINKTYSSIQDKLSSEQTTKDNNPNSEINHNSEIKNSQLNTGLCIQNSQMVASSQSNNSQFNTNSQFNNSQMVANSQFNNSSTEGLLLSYGFKEICSLKGKLLKISFSRKFIGLQYESFFEIFSSLGFRFKFREEGTNLIIYDDKTFCYQKGNQCHFAEDFKIKKTIQIQGQLKEYQRVSNPFKIKYNHNIPQNQYSNCDKDSNHDEHSNYDEHSDYQKYTNSGEYSNHHKYTNSDEHSDYQKYTNSDGDADHPVYSGSSILESPSLVFSQGESLFIYADTLIARIPGKYKQIYIHDDAIFTYDGSNLFKIQIDLELLNELIQNEIDLNNFKEHLEITKYEIGPGKIIIYNEFTLFENNNKLSHLIIEKDYIITDIFNAKEILKIEDESVFYKKGNKILAKKISLQMLHYQKKIYKSNEKLKIIEKNTHTNESTIKHYKKQSESAASSKEVIAESVLVKYCNGILMDFLFKIQKYHKALYLCNDENTKFNILFKLKKYKECLELKTNLNMRKRLFKAFLNEEDYQNCIQICIKDKDYENLFMLGCLLRKTTEKATNQEKTSNIKKIISNNELNNIGERILNIVSIYGKNNLRFLAAYKLGKINQCKNILKNSEYEKIFLKHHH